MFNLTTSLILSFNFGNKSSFENNIPAQKHEINGAGCRKNLLYKTLFFNKPNSSILPMAGNKVQNYII